MPVYTDTLRKGVIQSINELGSQAEFTRVTGLAPITVTRLKKRDKTEITDETYDAIYPCIKRYLPDNYDPYRVTLDKAVERRDTFNQEFSFMLETMAKLQRAVHTTVAKDIEEIANQLLIRCTSIHHAALDCREKNKG